MPIDDLKSRLPVESKTSCGEDTDGGDTNFDVSLRTIVLMDEIDTETSVAISMTLRQLEIDSLVRPITLYINSPGGSVYSMFSILDAMKACKAPIHTVGTGLVASAAVPILAAGAPGFRFLTPSTTVMIHEPMTGGWGRETDIRVMQQELKRISDAYFSFLAKVTGTDVKKFRDLVAKSDHWLTADKAVKTLHVADAILKEFLY